MDFEVDVGMVEHGCPPGDYLTRNYNPVNFQNIFLSTIWREDCQARYNTDYSNLFIRFYANIMSDMDRHYKKGGSWRYRTHDLMHHKKGKYVQHSYYTSLKSITHHSIPVSQIKIFVLIYGEKFLFYFKWEWLKLACFNDVDGFVFLIYFKGFFACHWNLISWLFISNI